MKCPVCRNAALVMTERQGVEIDYCPECRGVWLDRGELDKIIERSAGSGPAAGASEARQPAPWSGERGETPRKKKRESLLSELFDF